MRRSHLVTVATGPRLSDALISSPIIVEDGAVPGAGFEFGIDPNEDPELALVSLRIFCFHFLQFFIICCLSVFLSICDKSTEARVMWFSATTGNLM